jgi:TctA family transporter
MVLALAAIFFVLRRSLRLLYASLELAAAVATGMNVFSQLSPTQNTLSPLLTYLGAIYIAIRGYDNFEKGLDELKKKVAAQGVGGTGTAAK